MTRRKPSDARHDNNMMTVLMLMAAMASVACAFSSTNGQTTPFQNLHRGDLPVGKTITAMRVLKIDSKDATGDDGGSYNRMTTIIESRRNFIASLASVALGTTALTPWQASAEDATLAALPEVQVAATGDVKKLFTEGRALEAQGNILAAQRLYNKVTKIAPRFVYGWSNLGNTLVAQGQLGEAEESYSKAISLCEENLKEVEGGSFGTKRCDDLYLILLNRGSVRLNNGMPKEALMDLQRSNTIRARPDAVILQNLARAQEINSLYFQSDKSYTTAISMTANEVNPFWLRSSMVKYQLGDLNGAMDLMKRVANRFPEAPEVRAAYAVLLLAKGDEDAARKKLLELPDRQRARYAEGDYVDKVVQWPPVMKEGLGYLNKAVGGSP